MKILMVMNSLRSGGRERRALGLLKHLHKYPEIKIHIVFLSDEIFYKDFFDLPYTYSMHKRKFSKDPSIAFKIFRDVKRFKPDLIHCWSPMPVIYTILSSIFFKIPIVNSMISDAPKSFSLKNRIFVSVAAKFSKVILGNSYAGIRAYSTPKEKTKCIHNGFDFNRITNLKDKSSFMQELNLPSVKILGMVSSITSLKDHETLIKAAEIVLEKRQDFIILIVGDGPLADKIKNQISEKNRKSIIFTGARTDVESIVNIFYAGLLITHTEGISNAIMEYMALKKPVIATDGGGTNELVIDGHTGFLIPHRDSNYLADKINYILDNEDTIKTLGENGYNYLKKEFSIDVMKNRFMNVYKEILAH